MAHALSVQLSVGEDALDEQGTVESCSPLLADRV